jgi:hypothetical protein
MYEWTYLKDFSIIDSILRVMPTHKILSIALPDMSVRLNIRSRHQDAREVVIRIHTTVLHH